MDTFLVSLFLLMCVYMCGGEERAARLVEGEPQQTGATVAPIAGPEPFPAVGPVVMSILHLSCYELQIDRFEYSVCPFVNVTQRRVISSVPVLLGTWGGVYYNHGPNLVQEYQNGHHCKGTLMYRSVVRFTCDGDPEALDEETLPALVDVATDEEGCTITATLATPFPCALLGTARASSTATPLSDPPLSTSSSAAASDTKAEHAGSTTLETLGTAKAEDELAASGGSSTACEPSQGQELRALASAVEEIKEVVKDLAARQAVLARVVDDIKAWTET
jgi:hypothetical protein